MVKETKHANILNLLYQFISEMISSELRKILWKDNEVSNQLVMGRSCKVESVWCHKFITDYLKHLLWFWWSIILKNQN